MQNLYGWLFTYNPYTDNWVACKREDYLTLFTDNSNLLKSKDFDTLRDLIIKTEGDEGKIKDLLK